MNHISLLAFLLTGLVVYPLSMLLHECGHAAVGLALMRGQVVIVYGARDAPRRFRVGRLQIRFHRWTSFWSPAIAVAEGWAQQPVARRVLFLAGGPAASAALVLVALGAALRSAGSVWSAFWWAGAWVEIYLLLITLVPLRYPRVPGIVAGNTSDGLSILWLLRGGAHVRGEEATPPRPSNEGASGG